MELPVIAASLPSLNNAYQAALADTQTDQGEQGATFVSVTNKDRGTDIGDHATKIFTDSDPVQAAQQSKSRSIGQIASNPLKRLFRRG